MKKVNRIFLFLAGAVVTLTACNSSDSSKNSTATTTDSASVNKDSTYKADYNPATPGAQNGQ